MAVALAVVGSCLKLQCRTVLCSSLGRAAAMRYCDVDSVSFSDRGISASSIRAWRVRDVALGLSMFWELRYFEDLLGIGDPAAWRKAQQRQGVWHRLRCEWGMPASCIHPAPPDQSGTVSFASFSAEQLWSARFSWTS